MIWLAKDQLLRFHLQEEKMKGLTTFVFAVLIPILALVLGHMANMTCLSLVMVFLEIVFAMLLQVELNANK